MISCHNACDTYKRLACKDRNSTLCHEAMQKIPDMSISDCREETRILNSDIKSKE